jgi:serine protease Do
MVSLLRPSKFIGAAAACALAAAVVVTPPGILAQTTITDVLNRLNPFISHSHSSTPGYLGVLVTDVDHDSVQKLKLKDAHGALITLIDHDAPAGPVLQVNDVVVSVNGQNVDSADVYSRILREIPAGRKVTLGLIRDGAAQTITIQLCNRKAMEHDVWNKMNSADAFPPPATGMGILTGAGDASLPGFHMPFFSSTLNVGAIVEPLTSQMADYLEVSSGVMIKQVARKSEAAAAGLRAFDVVLKIGSDPIATTADWDRYLRSNQGKTVAITILRDRKQQTVNLQVDSKHRG